MKFVGNGNGKWVFKDRLSFSKIHAMNAKIPCRLILIPFNKFILRTDTCLCTYSLSKSATRGSCEFSLASSRMISLLRSS